jgi:hypothetical protein
LQRMRIAANSEANSETGSEVHMFGLSKDLLACFA